MKTFFYALVILLSLSSAVHATNYTNNGSSTNYSLNNGDTLRITGGTYTGGFNSFNTGAVVIVSAAATFKPAYINTPNGKIINYGTCEFGSLGTNSNFKFENYNIANVRGDLNLYDGSAQTWNNNVAAKMNVTGSFAMNNAVFTNYSALYVGGNFAMYTSTSNFINRGLVAVTGDVAISNGVFTNQNRITTDDFYAWGGQVVNEGSIVPKGNLVFSNGTTYTNQCLLVTEAGFINYGNYTNNGMLWVGRTGTDNDHFYNSGSFTNAPNAVVRAVKLTNYGVLAGGGSYYVKGDSYTTGIVGKSGTTTDSIKVYDVTRSSSSRIFDVQWGIVYSNVVYRPFAEPDTNNVNYTGCSSYYRLDLAGLLPVEWNYFTAKLVNNQSALTWSAQYEAGMKFEVERSYDNASFITVSTLLSNATKKYSYTEEITKKNTVVYYRIKATSSVNGAVKYSETKSLKISLANNKEITVYPNPVKDIASIQYNADNNGQFVVRINNAAGQQLMTKTMNALKGNNTFTLSETAGLKSGIYFVEISTNNAVIATERFVKN